MILVYDWESQEVKHEYVTDAVERGVIWRMAWLADNTLMGVSSGSAGMLLFWKPDKPGDFHRFKLPNQARDLDLRNGLSWWQLVKTGVISPVQSGLISLLAAVFGAT